MSKKSDIEDLKEEIRKAYLGCREACVLLKKFYDNLEEEPIDEN